MDLPRSGGQEKHIGKHAAFRITKYGEKGRNIVVSRRALLEEEEERKTREVMATLTEGMVMKGSSPPSGSSAPSSRSGPHRGAAPISEIGWDRVEDIQSVLSVGQEVEVAITRLDWANKRFSFSLKKTLADPWETAVDRFPGGIAPRGQGCPPGRLRGLRLPRRGVDGLLHISKLGGGKRIRNAGEVLRAGQEIEVKVDSVDPVKRRVALSLPGTESADAPEEEAEDYSKYMEPPPAAPALGSLGKPSRRKWSGRGSNPPRCGEEAPREPGVLLSSGHMFRIYERKHVGYRLRFPRKYGIWRRHHGQSWLTSCPQKSIHAGIPFDARIACRPRVSATISSSHAPCPTHTTIRPAAVPVQIPWVGKRRQVGERRVEVDILVHGVPDEPGELVHPGQGRSGRRRRRGGGRRSSRSGIPPCCTRWRETRRRRGPGPG